MREFCLRVLFFTEGQFQRLSLRYKSSEAFHREIYCNFWEESYQDTSKNDLSRISSFIDD